MNKKEVKPIVQYIYLIVDVKYNNILGFFYSEKQARKVIKEIQQSYKKGNKVYEIPKSEVEPGEWYFEKYEG